MMRNIVLMGMLLVGGMSELVAATTDNFTPLSPVAGACCFCRNAVCSHGFESGCSLQKKCLKSLQAEVDSFSSTSFYDLAQLWLQLRRSSFTDVTEVEELRQSIKRKI